MSFVSSHLRQGPLLMAPFNYAGQRFGSHSFEITPCNKVFYFPGCEKPIKIRLLQGSTKVDPLDDSVQFVWPSLGDSPCHNRIL